LQLTMVSSNVGYIGVGIADHGNMRNAELIVVTQEGNNYFLYEYEGPSWGNGRPNEKTDAGSWRLDSSEIVGSQLTVLISRSVNPNNCGICKEPFLAKKLTG